MSEVLKNYVLLGSSIFTIKGKNFVVIKDNEEIVGFSEICACNPQLLPTGCLVTNTQDKKGNSRVYFTDVKVINKNGDKILEFPVENMNHECIYGSNAPRYYTPQFDYDSLNTNVLCIRNEMITNENINRNEDIIDNLVVEYDSDGKMIWSWSASEHFSQLDLTDEEIFELHEYPIHIDAFGSGHDWIHLNSACALGPNKWYDAGDERFHPDNIICCSRNLSLIFIIDKNDGNIVYLLKGKYFDFQFQHYGHMIPKGLDGEGNILLLDCCSREDGRDAKILEINPDTNDVVFEYCGNFISDAMGSVQKLPDGCYLISACHSNKILIVNPKDNSVSEFNTEYLFYRVNAYPSAWIENIN